MFNVFALVLTVFTSFSGLCWWVKYLKKSRIIFSFFQSILKKILPTCNIFKYFKHMKLFILFKRVCYFCTVWMIDVCASIFPILFLVFLVRFFIFEPFQIPSGSMMPTLLSGDFILVNKFCYGIKNPITQNTLISVSHPKRGDIVVFKYPLNTKLDYIKRVIGLPGDRVIYNSLSKKLTIHPNCNSRNAHLTKIVPITYTNIVPSNFVQIFNINHGEVISNFRSFSADKNFNNGIRLIQSEESFDGIVHNILTITEPGSSYSLSMEMYDKGQLSEFISEWVVPFGKYFMLGDNRDNSADSRYWGFVPEKNIVGKAIMIWMSFDKHQDKHWPIIVRFNRIGKIY